VGPRAGLSGQVQKISPSLGFDLRTVQPVASRYADYTTRPTVTYYDSYRMFNVLDSFTKVKI
jgi:hypothetical protein